MPGQGGIDLLGDQVLVPIAHDQIHAFDGSQLRRRGLGMAAGDHDAGTGIGPDGLTNGLTALHGGFAGHRAGIDDHDVGHAVVSGGKAPIRFHQCIADGLGLALVDFAAEGFDK